MTVSTFCCTWSLISCCSIDLTIWEILIRSNSDSPGVAQVEGPDMTECPRIECPGITDYWHDIIPYQYMSTLKSQFSGNDKRK